MPDDDDQLWGEEDWEDGAGLDDPAEPEIFTLHRDDVDDATGRIADGASTTEAPSADDDEAGWDGSPSPEDDPDDEVTADPRDEPEPPVASGADDDILEAADSFDPPAFVEPAGDDVDRLFSGAIATQVEQQERLLDVLEELRDQVARLEVGGGSSSGTEELTDRIATLDGRFSLFEQRLDGLGDRLAGELTTAQERSAETLRGIGDASGLDDRLNLLEARIEGIAGRLDEARDQARAQADELIGLLREGVASADGTPASTDAVENAVASLKEKLEAVEAHLMTAAEGFQGTGIEQLTALSGRVEQLTDQVESNSATFQGLMDGVDQIRSGIEGEGRDTMAALGERLGALNTQLDELARSIGTEFEAVQLLSTGLERLQSATGTPDLTGLVEQLNADGQRRLDEMRSVLGDLAEQIAGGDGGRLEQLTAAQHQLADSLEEVRNDLVGRDAAPSAHALQDLEGRLVAIETMLGDLSGALASANDRLVNEIAQAGAGDQGEAVAQLRGTIAALADDVADAVSGAAAGVTRADIEGLEHALEQLAAGGSLDVSSLEDKLANQGQAIEQLSDALLGLSGAIQRTPQATAEAVEAAQSHAVTDFDGITDEIRATLAASQQRLEEAIGQLLAGTSAIDKRADDVLGRVAETLAKEGQEARRQLKDAGRQLGEAIDRVRALEASLVNYLIERDDRIANERSLIAAELTARLSEGLSRRDRKRIAGRLSSDAEVQPSEPRRQVPVPAPEPPEELTPARRSRRRPTPHAEAPEGRRRPLVPSEPLVHPTSAEDAARARAATDEPATPLAPRGRRPSPPPAAPTATESPSRRSGPAAPKAPAARDGRPGSDEDRAALSEVKGVGPARQDMLLEAFGDLAGVAAASVADLAEIPGISERLAKDIKGWANKRA